MSTDKNAARYQDVDKRDSESALSPPFDLVRPVFDVTDVWPVRCRLPWNFGGLPAMPIGFAGIEAIVKPKMRRVASPFDSLRAK